MEATDPPADKDPFFQTEHLKIDLAGRTARSGAVTIVTQGLKFIIGMVGTVILARLLTPQDYGLIGMVAVVIGFVSIFKDLGLSSATIQRAEINTQQISVLFWINVGLSVAVFCVCLAIAPLIASFYHEPRLQMITVASGVGFLLGGMTVQHEALLRRQMRFGAIAVGEILSLCSGIGTAVILAWKGWGYWALVASQLSLALVYMICMWKFCVWRPTTPTRNSGAGSMIRFGGNLTGFAVINYFARNLDNMLIGRVWGSQQLGFYAKAYQLLILPIEQINSPITAVALPALSRLTDSPERYRQAYLRIIQKIAILTMPGVALMIATSDWIVRIVLGAQWDQASKIFALLGIAGLIQPIASTTGILFITQDRTRDMFRWGLIGSSIIITSIIIGLPWGPVGVAGSYSVIYVCIVTPLLFWFVGRTGPVRTLDFYRGLAPFFVASIVSLLACLTFRQFVSVSRPLTGLIICSLIVLTISLTILWVTDVGRSTLLDTKSLILMVMQRKRAPQNPSTGGASWTVSFLRDWWSYMNFTSLLRLRNYELRLAKGELGQTAELALNMRRPVRGVVSLREVGSDIFTFDEVFKNEVYREVTQQLRECTTIIDLGANIGLASLYFAAHYPTCRILAVEPNPGTYEVLTRNLSELIQKARCQTQQVAVWGEDTVLSGAFDSEGHYSAFKTRGIEPSTKTELQVVAKPMNSLIAIAGFERIDLLKVDIEGAETALFKGDLSWLSKVKCIAIEFHENSRQESAFDSIMKAHGFSIVDEGSHTVLALNHNR